MGQYDKQLELAKQRSKAYNKQAFENMEIEEQVRKDGGDSMYNVMADAFQAGSMNTLEYSLGEKYVSSGENEDTPNLSLKEIKENYDLEVNTPMPAAQAAFLAEARDHKEEVMARIGERFSLDTPIDALATFAGMAAVVSLNPTNLALSAAIGAVATPVGGALAGAGRGLKRTLDIIKIAKTASRLAKATKLTKKVAPVLRPSMVKAAEKVAKVVTAKFTKAAAREGTANAVEELLIHSVEASKGYHYDRNSAVAVGFFAPVVLMGAVKVFSEGFKKGVKTTKKAFRKVKKAETAKNLDEYVSGLQKELDESALVKKKKLEEARSRVDELKSEAKRLEDPDATAKVEINKVDPDATAKVDKYDPFDLKYDIGEESGLKELYYKYSDVMEQPNFKARYEYFKKTYMKDAKIDPEVKELGDSFEAFAKVEEVFDNVDDILTYTAKHMLKAGYKADLLDLFPFLKSMNKLNTWFDVVRRDIKAKYGTDQISKDLLQQEFFSVDQVKFAEFHKNKVIDFPKPTKRNLDVGNKAMVTNPQKAAQAKIEAAATSDNGLDKTAGFASKDIDTALDDFFSCLKGKSKSADAGKVTENWLLAGTVAGLAALGAFRLADTTAYDAGMKLKNMLNNMFSNNDGTPVKDIIKDTETEKDKKKHRTRGRRETKTT